MEKIYTIIDAQTGKELRAMFECDINSDFTSSKIQDNELAIENLRTEAMENPYFDFQTRTFYDKVE